MLSQLFKGPLNRSNIICFIGVAQNIVYIDKNEDIKLHIQDLIDIALEARQSIG